MTHVSNIQSISAHQLYSLREKGEAPVLIDVRTDAEYKEGHIEGCVHIPLDNFSSQAVERILGDNEDMPVYIVCAGGVRSYKACVYLGQHHFVNPIVNIGGGIHSWVHAGYRLEKGRRII